MYACSTFLMKIFHLIFRHLGKCQPKYQNFLQVGASLVASIYCQSDMSRISRTFKLFVRSYCMHEVLFCNSFACSYQPNQIATSFKGNKISKRPPILTSSFIRCQKRQRKITPCLNLYSKFELGVIFCCRFWHQLEDEIKKRDFLRSCYL